MQTTLNTFELTRINNDVNGNPRYVAHFLNFVNDADRVKAEYLEKTVSPFQFSISHLYEIALSKARKFGGKKYSNKQYGGGIVFQSYNTDEIYQYSADCKKMPVFIQEFIPAHTFKRIYKAITRHFSWVTLNTNNGVKTFANVTPVEISDFLGLAYTSSSSYAGLWVCNVEAENKAFPGFKYVGFAADQDGNYYAILQDNEENEKILPL